MAVEALLAALTPEARLEAIDIGAQFNKTEVLDQITSTRAAFAKTGGELAQHGYTAADDAELGEVEVSARGATEDRTGAHLTTRGGRDAYRRVVTKAKGDVKNGTSVLRNLASAVARKPDADNPTAGSQIGTSLALAGPVGRSSKKISDQVDILLNAFKDDAIAKAGKDRGIAEAKARLEKARAALDAGRPVHLAPNGTPVETQAQNLIEGLAVHYLREARKAARAAADRLGDPALAKAYELSALYGAGDGGSGHSEIVAPPPPPQPRQPPEPPPQPPEPPQPQ